MDSLVTAAARALAAGDPLGALNLVALRTDAPALALRGIAMAQLGDFPKARALIKSAARAFGPKEGRARARCVVAEAEIALASRDLGWPAKSLEAARRTLEEHGDAINAAHARYLEIRRDVLIGRLEIARRSLAAVDAARLPAALRTVHELLVAAIAIRHLHTADAKAALERASQAAHAARIPALLAEVRAAAQSLDAPAARVARRGVDEPLRLADVETLLASRALVIDACRNAVRGGGTVVSLVSRPVLFTLLRALGEAWPNDVPRGELVRRAFRAREADESYRARLRVEMGRLRRAVAKLATIEATPDGFALRPRRAREVVVLKPAVDGDHGDVLAFLADGESWSSSALALALGASQRTVQRALDELSAARKVQSYGRGRARRWMTPPLPGIATSLLLPAPPTGG
ncbi:MAG TPA: hypothetical protein VMF52_09290 [Steroidobacteraceae bacterium]|nr:hypothetical protein [Steroidobacteraceae bacterium]